MKLTFQNRRDRKEADRIQEEILLAKSIQHQNPSMKWTTCLKLAYDTLKSKPIY